MEQYAKRHTPGPWNYGFSTVSPIIEVYKYSDNKRSSRLLAEVIITKGAKDNDQAEADARLIAAAPDLLAIVEGMVLYPDVRKHIESKFPGFIKQAEAAIAKVQGGAK